MRKSVFLFLFTLVIQVKEISKTTNNNNNNKTETPTIQLKEDKRYYIYTQNICTSNKKRCDCTTG